MLEIFNKEYAPNWSEELFLINKIKNTIPQIYVINDLNGGKSFGICYGKELQKNNKKEFIIEKTTKRKKISYMLKIES